MNKKDVFAKFTNQYSLSKTLRFELKPVGETLENMRKQLGYDKDLQTFMKDQDIEDAYQFLKPLIDEIHEYFITESLKSNKAKEIDFAGYLKSYREKIDDKGEKKLREKIGELYKNGGEEIKKNYKIGWKWDKKKSSINENFPLTWKVGGKIKEGAEILKSPDVIYAAIKNSNVDKKLLEKHLKSFEGFFTYFSGFNQNRENYYKTEGKASQIATRIIDENLPKFCDNILQFECIKKKKKDGTIEEFERKEEYKNTYQYLKERGITTTIKDARKGENIELSLITDEIFGITYFNHCFSQTGIEEYNRVIGHYNLLINLYNQVKRKEEKDLPKDKKIFKNLPQFKTLYKQIGCGEKKTLFFSLTHDTEEAAKENKERYPMPYSVERILKQVKRAGEKYFMKSEKGNDEEIKEIKTIPDFLDYVLNEKEGFEDVYWSKAAFNTISSKYFVNWHDLKDRLKDAKVVSKKSGENDEDITIPEAIELAGLFEVLDATENWRDSFFKEVLTKTEDITDEAEKKKREQRKQIIDEAKSLSTALLQMIFADMRENMQSFLSSVDGVLKIRNYKTNESRKKIKELMDRVKYTIQMLKYFNVNENKIKDKGNSFDSKIANALKEIIFEAKLDEDTEEKAEVNWFKWYDALRNFLTKKPQDSAKENKLKLNFEKGNLMGGFVDSHTDNDKPDNATQYGGYLFRKHSYDLKEYEYFLGISKDSNLFRCYLQNTVMESNKSDFNRLEYYQPKSSTFFSSKYSENKTKLFEYISEKIKRIAEKKKELLLTNEEKENFKKKVEVRMFKGNTPTQLIENIRKEKENLEFQEIFNDENLLSIVNEMIVEMKSFTKNYENRTPSLKKIQNENYEGIFGLKSIIDDLQKIAKETKVYNYFSVSQKEFDYACNRKEKPLYLFKIVNKDLSKTAETRKKDENKNHRKNLHTLYYEMLMSGEQETIDIGRGTIFYRKRGVNKKIVKKGYENKPWVIENKRFTGNDELEKQNRQSSVCDGKSFFLHLSTFLNYVEIKGIDKGKPTGKAIEKVHKKVYQNFSNQPEVCFLGLDRGEKHLAYYSLVNSKGEIVDQDTLNLPFTDNDGKSRSVEKDGYIWNQKEWKPKKFICKDYNDLLEAVASNREMARENWQTINTIKELKNGYVSHAIRKVVDLAVDLDNQQPTFIVLEDLNTGFKRGRQKIEKSVYQKFETTLAKKLNFLVDKSKKEGLGSPAQALQLTPPVQNYRDIEKKNQVGIMLYTRANYTSQTDPVTGWRKTIYLQKGSEEYIKAQIIGGKHNRKVYKAKFTDIYHENGDYIFLYKDENTEKEWKLYSSINGVSLDRFRGKREDKNEWSVEKYDIVEILDNVFVDFDKKRSLLDQINEGIIPKKFENNESKMFKNLEKFTSWELLRFGIDLIQQIRNTGENERDKDFIQSPVRYEENDKHFDSRGYLDREKNKEKVNLPTSGDANGAYNIARKGIIMNEHIKQWKHDGEKNKDLNLFVSDEEWDLWLDYQNKQKHNYKWKEMLSIFSSQKKMKEYQKRKK